MSARVPLVIVAAIAVQAAFVSGTVLGASKPALDYEFFKSRVEPIFLQKRDGHARCYVCHAESNNNLRLERLPAGAPFWSEDQSRQNFATVAKLVNPGDPDTSRLLLHPLAPEGGGDVFHSGGRQFPTKSDPNWKTLAQWVNGATLADRSKK